MSSDDDSTSPDSPERSVFDYIESGMSLVYEYQTIGQMSVGFGQTIFVRPVVACKGYSKRKEFTTSLRFIHATYDNREIGRCLLDRDEVAAWIHFLTSMLSVSTECTVDLKVQRLDYVSRHGIRLVCRPDNAAPYTLHVASEQAALLPSASFATDLLAILGEFEAFCEGFD